MAVAVAFLLPKYYGIIENDKNWSAHVTISGAL
jgi:hypothetical protein